MRGAYLALLGVLYDCTKSIINSIHALEQGISHAQEFFPTTLYILDWIFLMGSVAASAKQLCYVHYWFIVG